MSLDTIAAMLAAGDRGPFLDWVSAAPENATKAGVRECLAAMGKRYQRLADGTRECAQRADRSSDYHRELGEAARYQQLADTYAAIANSPLHELEA
jgi:DNA-binding GntR family transcriptional regulator